MARASAAQWAKRVERWKDSGLTAKEFAAETGINSSTLSYWRWKLAAKDAGRKPPGKPAAARTARKRRLRTKTREVTPRFVEVPVATVATASAALELLLGDVRVRVPEGFDEATLTRVVRAVGAAR